MDFNVSRLNSFPIASTPYCAAIICVFAVGNDKRYLISLGDKDYSADRNSYFTRKILVTDKTHVTFYSICVRRTNSLVDGQI